VILEPRFSQPDGWQWSTITPRDGQDLRYGWVVPKAAKAICFIFPGLSEFGEKYFEAVRDLTARSIAVAVIDWRGQGMSWRHPPDPEKRHHDDFALDVEDAAAFVAALDKTPALAKLPKIVLGHSMGGHTALRMMHDYPEAFRCAVLTAPMFGINLPLHMEGPARLTAEAACRMGWADHFILGGGRWSMSVFMNNLNLLTSDTDRRAMMKYWMTEAPALQMGGLTYGWVRAALATNRLTHDAAWLATIKTPTLITLPEREMIVSNNATTSGAKAMPNAQVLEIDGALHEILMERDIFRNTFWAAFDAFVAKHLT